MAIYELTSDRIEKLPETTFGAANVRERDDLQRVLRDRIEVIAPDTLIVAEEFADWEDSRRRIDLLGLDRDANLVAIELKRTEDGGHMELQALRYAAMVSTLTFEGVEEQFRHYLRRLNRLEDPRATILDFLGWAEPDPDAFGRDVRIVLASAEFSKELTTTVMWLNGRGLDVRCVRLKPYRYGETLLLDVQQVIPLPEAADYIIQIKAKEQAERVARQTSPDRTKYDVIVGGLPKPGLGKGRAIFEVVRALCVAGVTPAEVEAALPAHTGRLFRSVEGMVDRTTFVERLSEAASEGGRRFEARRYFCDDDELIVGDGKSYAFTTQWGTGTEDAIAALLERYSDRGVAFRRSEGPA